MHPELVLIACAILAIFLVPSLITVRPRYISDEDLATLSGASSQPAE